MHGKLIKWKDDRGFGFILCEHNQQEVFVHISAFPSGSPRPKVGEMLGFEIETTADGKTRAINISRAASLKPKASPVKLSKTPGKTTKSISLIIAVILVVLIAVSVSQKFTSAPTSAATEQITPSGISTVPEVTATQFSCDGRTHCSEMTSCAEAKYFLKNCPNTMMDGDQDGVPCEAQHCVF
ncbi:cold shock domain-containing protein [Methylophaga muralis]|uniref:Excalibur calcium-binding domain protein n=1 Tax=Methylophaga muralis TaxID=291169 RepID=A0A1E3GTD4_9GAMM|nr:cold shock domain-containing protein [Methylophaga muralis]ODN67274.1 Excalibur calcium-binding domain protein [Methylophaga muralis]